SSHADVLAGGAGVLALLLETGLALGLGEVDGPRGGIVAEHAALALLGLPVGLPVRLPAGGGTQFDQTVPAVAPQPTEDRSEQHGDHPGDGGANGDARPGL